MSKSAQSYFYDERVKESRSDAWRPHRSRGRDYCHCRQTQQDLFSLKPSSVASGELFLSARYASRRQNLPQYAVLVGQLALLAVGLGST